MTWTPRGSDALGIANSRVCLALLRVFRDVPLNIDPHSHDDVAKPFWPAIRLERRALQRGLKASRALLGGLPFQRGRKSRALDDEGLANEDPAWLTALTQASGTLPVEVPDQSALSLLGAALLKDAPACRDLFDAIERRLERHAAQPLPIDRNIAWLTRLLGLDTAESRMLALCAAIEHGTIERDGFGYATSRSRRVHVLRAALDLASDMELLPFVSGQGALARSGLIQRKERLDFDLEDVLRLSRLGAILATGEFGSIDEMAAKVLRPMPRSTQALAWPHLQARTDLLQQMLGNALHSGEVGINILLYGPPGTGKTAYSRQLVEGAGAVAYGIDDKDVWQLPASRIERLGSLRLSEIFAPARGSVLVLDEAEDIFQADSGSTSLRSWGSADSKSWMNQQLENNRTPVIWISNEIDEIDPAYLRRFTYCLEFPVPPRSLRRDIARGHMAPVGGTQRLVDAIASHAGLPPALVGSAARFVRLCGVAPEQVDAAAMHMLTDHLRAMGQSFSAPVSDGTLRFDLGYLNVRGSAQPGPMLASLAKSARASVLLSGAPGTGKTQLAGEIARRLGKELVYRTAADINSKWYGESERNVAKLFTDCDPAAEVLFLDEAETLLGDRAATVHRADRAVTAEFLRRLEAFDGVFICATNHAAAFDPALMRRFVFRLQFLPLAVPQREQMLGECIAKPDPGGIGAMGASQRARLHRLDQLTPGDFANVARRFRALGIEAGAGQWLDELEAEHQAKPDLARGAMGFV